MSERGILFSPPMVCALLAGRKTQTRRIVHPNHDRIARKGDQLLDGQWYRPFCATGDRLYVREAVAAEELSRPPTPRPATKRERDQLGRTSVIACSEMDGADGVRYLADDAWLPIENTPEAGEAWSVLFHYGDGQQSGLRGKGVPSIHMPRWASRLWLSVTDVRVERLQSISENDARSEGVEYDGNFEWRDYEGRHPHMLSARESFATLWDSLGRDQGGRWRDNPWVIAVSFEVNLGNIDAGGARG